jgi:enoyl-CoA hydratase/carnithine racemase
LLYVPEIERGMNMSWQSVPRSVALIGPAKTKRMFTLAEKVPAKLAISWGWGDYLCEVGGALSKALEIAEQANAMPPLALATSKEAINRTANALLDAVSYMDSDQFVLMQYSDDYEEGIKSFIEKRKPNYLGR